MGKADVLAFEYLKYSVQHCDSGHLRRKITLSLFSCTFHALGLPLCWWCWFVIRYEASPVCRVCTDSSCVNLAVSAELCPYP